MRYNTNYKIYPWRATICTAYRQRNGGGWDSTAYIVILNAKATVNVFVRKNGPEQNVDKLNVQKISKDFKNYLRKTTTLRWYLHYNGFFSCLLRTECYEHLWRNILYNRFEFKINSWLTIFADIVFCLQP